MSLQATLTACSLAFVLAGAARAQGWDGTSEVGFVMARGNSQTQTGNAKLDLSYELDGTKHMFAAGALYGETGEVVTAQRWDARWQTEWKLSDRTFWFGGLRYEDDRYSGFDYQGSASAGLGYAFIDTDATKLRAQIGGGYRLLQSELLVRDETGEVIERIAGQSGADAVVNAALKFEHAFNDATKVINSLLVESGQDNTTLQNQLALQVKMTEVLALSLGFSVRNNSNPPESLDNTDTLTTVNLVYQMM